VPPAITLQPQGQIVVLSTNFSLKGGAVGTAPLSYQWRMNGTNLPGATATVLAFTNIQFSDAGSYTMVVTNIGGATSSVPAAITVIEPDAVALRSNLKTQCGGIRVSRRRGKPPARIFGDPRLTLPAFAAWNGRDLTTLQLGNNLISDLSVLASALLTNISL
jgi:hypothetical protein